MNNEELIEALRFCADTDSWRGCAGCTVGDWEDCCGRLLRDAANALEAAEKRIAELESNIPIVESVLVDKLNQRIAELEIETERLKSSNDELRERQTYIDHWGNKWITSGKDVPTAAYNHGFLDGEKAVSVDLRSVGKGEQE